MKALVGLGNTSKKYSNTKHNFGFWIIDELLSKGSLKLKEGKGNYLLSKSISTLYIKPTTDMNNSGIAIMQLCNYFNIISADMLIIHDDIDLPLGTIKFKKNGGSGGHRGIDSIIYHLRTDNFKRLRIGIATNEEMRPSEKYVLKPFSKKYNKIVNETIENASNSINYYLEHGIVKSMNKFNKRDTNNGE